MQPRTVMPALDRERRRVEDRMREILARERGIPRRLRAAMTHSLFGGGKRLRPVLLLWTYDAFRTRRRASTRASRYRALQTGCAVEMIHTYSLIHDDLPAMDDDVLRRGRATCHIAFDEATAILAGDGLQALAFAVLARTGGLAGTLTKFFADAAGPAGMVGGQVEDLAAEGRAVTAAVVRRIHERKTARLIAACLAAGAWLAGADPRAVSRIQEAGLWLGLAFQGADDLLDLTASAAELGKSVRKDEAAGKATWVRVEGLDKARRRTARYGRQGLESLRTSLPTGGRADRLLALVQLMCHRQR